MTVTEAVQAVLVADAPVLALCPAVRIRVPGRWEGLARPYIIHFPVALENIRTHSEGLAAMRIWDSYQVSIFADAMSEAETLAYAVRTALDGVTAAGVSIFWTGWLYNFEWEEGAPESQSAGGTHHIALDFQIAEAL